MIKSTHPTSREDLNIRQLVVNATKNVFETMLSLHVECEEQPADSSSAMRGLRVAGSLGFAGEGGGGGIYVQFLEPFASCIAKSALQLAEGSNVSAGDVNDVVGELCNMIGGTIASRLSDLGLKCRPTIPFITRGTSFEVELAGGATPEIFTFTHGTDRFVVGIYVKRC